MDFVKELILTIVQIILPIVISIGIAFLCKFLAIKKESIKAETDNAKMQALLDEAYSAITTAVTAINQTYVDTLKKSNKFTVENQKEALASAINMAQTLISDETRDYINKTYGNVSVWLAANIEAEVKEQKIEGMNDA